MAVTTRGNFLKCRYTSPPAPLFPNIALHPLLPSLLLFLLSVADGDLFCHQNCTSLFFHFYFTQAFHEQLSVAEVTNACFEPANQVFLEFFFRTVCVHHHDCHVSPDGEMRPPAWEVHGVLHALQGGRCAQGRQRGHRHHQDEAEHPVCRLVSHWIQGKGQVSKNSLNR